jgi:hypothetical protein
MGSSRKREASINQRGFTLATTVKTGSRVLKLWRSGLLVLKQTRKNYAANRR